ncbi:MAG TPA: homoaconitate hydratase [Candidatus Dormibacteraeota bacterium]|nr:homoaconitate hydratase [Candidatus Dormibacteraeota bacterium]
MPTTTNSHIWVSALNARPEIRAPFPKSTVRFYDTTLRDGEQTVGVVLSPQQKLEIARHLDALGIDRIEAGFPRVSVDDAEAITLMLKANLKAELWGFSRAVQPDVEELVRLGLQASVIESPTSEIKLRAYGITPDDLLAKVKSAVSFATKQNIRVAFFAVDSTRTDLAFLRRVYDAAIEAGAAEIVVVDTIGACGPEAVEFLVRQVREWVGPAIPVHFHGHDDFGMATACAIAAVRAGATWIQGTINGMGERAGNADLGEIALALKCLYEVPVALDLGKIREVSEIVRKASGYHLAPWKPLVGENLFMRESGAVASQFHIPEAIEPYSSELVHAERRIVLGKKSGLDSIDLKAKELGLSIAPDRRAALLAAVKKLAIAERRLVTDAEFRAIVDASKPS